MSSFRGCSWRLAFSIVASETWLSYDLSQRGELSHDCGAARGLGVVLGPELVDENLRFESGPDCVVARANDGLVGLTRRSAT
jgi:hypothetical protein